MSYFGLTGGAASGKTTVARMFEDLGAKIIDADRIGYELLKTPSPLYREVLQRFGLEVLDSSGEIDRKRLGAIVFADPEKLRELNAIVHPRIIDRVEELAGAYQTHDPRAVILVDAALIFEAGIGGRFKKVIVAWCRPKQQIERQMAMRGLTPEEAERRLAVQMPVEEKRHRADYVIDCSGELESTRQQVEIIFSQLKRQVETS